MLPVSIIIDIGVVVGLAWGLLSFYYFLFVAFTLGFNQSPEVNLVNSLFTNNLSN